MEWFKKVVFHNYANFEGRARRKEFWMFALFYAIFSIILQAIDASLGTGGVLSVLYGLALFIPYFAVMVRRLHDTGTSGHMLWILLTVIGAFWIFFLLAKASAEGENKYGTSPKLITPSTDVENLKSSVDGVAESHQDSTPDQTKVFCSQCGEPNTKDNSFCVKCGKALT